jgi:hypothetical protein
MNGNLVMVRAGPDNARNVRTITSIEQHNIAVFHDERALSMEIKDSGG